MYMNQEVTCHTSLHILLYKCYILLTIRCFIQISVARASPTMSTSLYTVIITLCGVSSSVAFSRGAPSFACDSMVPGHGVNPALDSCPYEVIADEWSPGATINSKWFNSNSNNNNF